MAGARYIQTFINQIKSKGNEKMFDIEGVSSYPVFDISQFDCIQILRKPLGPTDDNKFTPAGKKRDEPY